MIVIEAKKVQQLDLNLLKVFECLYQERNMSLAAQLLYISPSAVSHAVKRLRLMLSDELFVRQGQLMQPTPACERMAPQLLETLNKLRQILQACGEFDLSLTEQTFKLATHDTLEPLLLPKLHAVLSKHAPQAKLMLVKLSREDMQRELAARRIDVAIDVALPLKTPIKHFSLSSDYFCVLMSKKRGEKAKLTANQYESAKHIAVSNRSTGVVFEDIGLLQLGINRDVNIRCQSYQAAREVVRGSDYMLTLPSLIANQLLEDRGEDSELMVQPLPYKMPHIETRLYWHQNTQEDEALKWFRNAIQSIFGQNH